MRAPQGRGSLRLTAATALALASLSLASASPALAGPKGGTVRGGQAAITTKGGVTTIRQGSQRVVIDWRSFDIDADEAVRFVQPGRKAIALNRVLDGLPTHIRGQLLANGNVWLVNPSGVMFHAGSVVDVGGLLATTADVENDAFMRGDYRFDTPGDPDARIVNEGRITFKEAGLAGFVAPEVINRGEIEGKVGKIVIAGHERFSVEVSGDGMFELDLGPRGPEGGGRAVNLGRLAAEGGTIVLSAAAVRGAVEAAVHAGGVIEARSARVEGGRIVLDGGDGRVEVTGALDVSGRTGGEVDVAGAEINLRAAARIDASGDEGGGRVRVGGGRNGAGPQQGGLRPADKVGVERGAFVTVSAGDAGDGGEAIFWSEDATLFYGAVDARGGAAGGDGGFVEVSSRLDLAFAGEVDLSAPLGTAGEILFDPRDIRIVASGGTSISGGVGVDDFQPDDLAVSAGSLAAISGSITLQASRDIVFEAGGGLVNFRADSIAFEAGRDIVVQPNAIVGRGLTLTADAALPGQASDGIGAIRVTGTAGITASGTLRLSAPQGLIGTDMASTDTLTLRARTTLNVPDAVMAGGLEATSVSGALNLGDVQAARLTARGGGGLGTGGTFDIAGGTSFTAPGAAVTLGSAGNRFGGPLSIDTRDGSGTPRAVTVVATGALELGRIAAGTLTVTTDGALTGSGLVDAANAARLDAASIALSNDANVFGGALTLMGGGDASVVAGGAVSLGDVALGSLTLIAGGGVDEAPTGVTSIAGAASFTTPGATVVLQRAGGSVGGAISVDTAAGGAAPAAVTLALAGDLTLGDVTASALQTTAGGAVRQGPGGTLDLQTLELSAGGAATLLGAGNVFGAEIDVSAADLTLIAASGVLLNDIATGGLTVIAGGAVSQTDGGVIATIDDAAIATSGGAVTLTNADNVFGGAVGVVTTEGGAAAADVTLNVGAATLTLGTTVAEDLVVTALGGLSQAGAVIAGGTRAITGGGAVDLSGPGNAFGPIDVDTTAGGAGAADVALASDGELELGDITAARLSAATGGGLRQTVGGVLEASGEAQFMTQGGAADLSNDNLFAGTVAVDTTAGGAGPASVALGDADALTLGAVTASALTLTTGGAVDQAAGGALVIAGDVRVETAGGAVTLDRTANAFGGEASFDTTAGGAARAAVAVTTAGALSLGPIAAQTLEIFASGAVTDRAGGVLDVAGASSFSTDGAALSLESEAGHRFGGPITLDAGAASIVSAGAVALQGAALSLDVAAADVEAPGALTIGGGTGTLTLRSLNGQDLALGGSGGGFDLSQSSLDLISAGRTEVAAADGRSVTVRGGAVLSGLGDVTLAADGGVTFEAGGAVFAGTLGIESGGAVVGDASALSTGGAVIVQAAGDVTLSAANAFGGAVSVTAPGREVSLGSASDLTLGDLSASGVIVEAPGGIDAQGVLNLAGDATLSAFDSLGDGRADTSVFGDVTATAAGNRIGGVLSVVGGSVDVAADGDLRLQDSLARTSLSITAGGSATIARVAVGAGAPTGDALAPPPERGPVGGRRRRYRGERRSGRRCGLRRLRHDGDERRFRRPVDHADPGGRGRPGHGRHRRRGDGDGRSGDGRRVAGRGGGRRRFGASARRARFRSGRAARLASMACARHGWRRRAPPSG